MILLLVFKGLCAFCLQIVGLLHIQLKLSIVKQNFGNNTVPFLRRNWVDFSVASFGCKVVWNVFFGITQETEPACTGNFMIKCQRVFTRIISQRNRPANSVQWVQWSKIFLITSNISRLGFGNSYSDSSQYWYTLQTHFRPPWFIGCFNLHPSYNSWTHRLLVLNKLRPSSRVFFKRCWGIARGPFHGNI